MCHKYKKMRKGHFWGDGSWFQASIYNGSRDNGKKPVFAKHVFLQ